VLSGFLFSTQTPSNTFGSDGAQPKIKINDKNRDGIIPNFFIIIN